MNKHKNTRIAALGLVAGLALTGCTSQSGGQADATTAAAEADGPTTIYIVRHGQTWFNEKGVVSGWSDSFLTHKGEEQAEAAGDALADVPFDTALTSDIDRAEHTAELILAANSTETELVPVRELREQNYGGFDGDTDEELWTPIMAMMGHPYDPSQTGEGGFWDNEGVLDWYYSSSEADIMDAIAAADEAGYAEDWADYEGRLTEGVDLIAEAAEEHPGGNILVVSHGGAIDTILGLMDSDYESVDIGNASITTVTYEDGNFHVSAAGVDPEDF